MKCIRSIGDLRARLSDKSKAFWDIESPAYELTNGPAWLEIDPRTGALTGKPVATGSVKVVITATIDVQVRTLDRCM